MDEFGLVVHSETAGDIGFVTLTKCDLFALFMAGGSGKVPSLDHKPSNLSHPFQTGNCNATL